MTIVQLPPQINTQVTGYLIPLGNSLDTRASIQCREKGCDIDIDRNI